MKSLGTSPPTFTAAVECDGGDGGLGEDWGQSASGAYAGGAPGLYAGILQVNAIIPSGATSGSNTLMLNIGGVASPLGVTVAGK
jgi:hypothetical protein